MKYLILLSSLLAFNAHADMTTSNDDLILADEAIQSPSMDLEGQYKVQEAKPAPVAEKQIAVAEKQIAVAPKKVQRRLSQSDKLKIYRERLEERNRIMVERKMEQIRFQQELALARKLEQSMNQTMKAIDNVK